MSGVAQWNKLTPSVQAAGGEAYVPPNLTTAQRLAITDHFDGMRCFDTTLGVQYWWSVAANDWVAVGEGFPGYKDESLQGFIPSPTDGNYTLALYATVACTIDTFYAATDVGTTVATILIDGVAVTGIDGVTVDDGLLSFPATANNVVSVGSTILLVLASGSGASRLAFTLKCTAP